METPDSAADPKAVNNSEVILAAAVMKTFQLISNSFIVMYVVNTVFMAFNHDFALTFLQSAILFLSYGILTFDSKAAAARAHVLKMNSEASVMYTTMVFLKPGFAFLVFVLIRQVL